MVAHKINIDWEAVQKAMQELNNEIVNLQNKLTLDEVDVLLASTALIDMELFEVE